MNSSAGGSSHLAFALRWLPRDRREDAMTFYRFCREIDDIADEPGRSPAEKRALLDGWLESLSGTLPPDLAAVVERRGIDPQLLAEIVRGCAMDIEPLRFGTFADLEHYCWRVACAVGLVSIRIFGCQDPASETYATHLGHALQLTNILRDVGEDAQMGRIYLPLEALEHFGVREDDLLNARPGSGFVPLMRSVAGRARDRFAAAIPPAADTQALLAPEIMRALYEKILARLDAQEFPVFQRRLRLNRWEKFTTALGVVWHRRQGARGISP